MTTTSADDFTNRFVASPSSFPAKAELCSSNNAMHMTSLKHMMRQYAATPTTPTRPQPIMMKKKTSLLCDLHLQAPKATAASPPNKRNLCFEETANSAANASLMRPNKRQRRYQRRNSKTPAMLMHDLALAGRRRRRVLAFADEEDDGSDHLSALCISESKWDDGLKIAEKLVQQLQIRQQQQQQKSHATTTTTSDYLAAAATTVANSSQSRV